MANSILTNSGAATALQNSNAIERNRDVLARQQATGRRVNSAVDNASAFTIAQLLQGDLKSFGAVEQGIDNARGVLAVTNAAATAASDQLANLNATIIAAQNPGNTSQQQAIYNADFQSQVAQLNQTLQNASFNGRNLLSGGSTSLNVLANIDGTTVTVQSNSSFATAAANLGAQSLSTQAAAQQAFSALQQAQASISTVLGNVGADTRTLNSQSQFLSVLNDATQEGLGAIVDANLGSTAARSQAEAARGQLSTLSLNIAKWQPQSIFGLFR
jgi:flagellin